MPASAPGRRAKGHGLSWSDSASELRRQGRIDDATLTEIRWLALFGRLIANTDMHGGNLSFFTRGTRVIGLAPAYDMGPALYAPTLGHVREPPFAPPTPEPTDGPAWDSACAAAIAFWGAVAHHPRVSPAFQSIAAGNAAAVKRVQALGRLLPA